MTLVFYTEGFCCHCGKVGFILPWGSDPKCSDCYGYDVVSVFKDCQRVEIARKSCSNCHQEFDSMMCCQCNDLPIDE